MNTRLWDIYQMPGGDWTFAAAGRITDGYEEERDAMVACLDYLTAEVARLERMAAAGEELVATAGAVLNTRFVAAALRGGKSEYHEKVIALEKAIADFEEASK